MRYYECVLKTNAEQIEENAKIKLRDYDYDSSISAMNRFLSQKVKNDMTFFAYRDEGDKTLAAFSYDEMKSSYSDAYDFIFGMLYDTFCINRIKEEPCEITMYKFLDDLNEARRRGYALHCNRVIDASKLSWLYDYSKSDFKMICCDFEEIIVSDHKKPHDLMYDDSFTKELSNIEAHKNVSGYEGNMVHYIISARSIEAARKMTEILIQRLAEANRVSSRRMDIITDIKPDLFKANNHLEEIIENNYGGTIIFDLSEKFGCNPAEYGMTSKYIENLVQRYRNHCLFVFMYNMKKPGFSYYVLPELKKYVIPVTLREGTGDRKTAVKYMKELIKDSGYAKYAGQAGEFMKRFPGNEFSQTDVLMAYEQFGAWCLNKNILQAYDYNPSENFMLDRDENAESSYDKLNKMIGLNIVKEQITHIIATDIVEKERKRRQGNNYQMGTMHMIFGGNPGSAKTTVAKLFAGIAKEKGILKSGAFVDFEGMKQTCSSITDAIRTAFVAAKGGVLFIDEAYALQSSAVITPLIQEMENHREDVIVILAGYNEGMRAFMETNEGLKSRIPYWIDFPDYNTDELTDIFKLMLQERGFTATDDAIKKARNIFERVRFAENFGNGRYVRNLIERATQKQSVRLLSARKEAGNIRKAELFKITAEDVDTPERGLKDEREVGAAQKELDDMIGLSSVKAVIHKAVAGFKLKKICMDKGISKEKPSLHMVFTGNPGTAKTTVARLFAEIMKDEKMLSTGAFVEVGRADLVGAFVGHTAKLVKKKFQEAQGGVLFIDEAYSLCDDRENSFGDEAINTIVQEMENHRDNVVVIFAGYPDKMKHFLERNPGMSSRIAFHVEFEDYSTDELCAITKLMISKKDMKITDAAMEKLRMIYEKVRESNDYGNGRFVRKMLEEAEMNLAERILHLDESEITEQMVTTIDEMDITEPEMKNHQEKNPIGF